MTIDSLIAVWGTWIWAASWQVSILLLLVMASNLALGRLPARFRYVLLLLVFAKLVLPPSLTAPWSIGHTLTPESTPTNSWLAIFSDPIVGARSIEGLDVSIGVRGNPDFWKALSLSDSVAIPVVRTAFIFWLLGIGLFATQAIRSQYSLSKAVAAGRRVDDGCLYEELRRCAAELGIRRLPRLVLLAEVSSPFLCGLIRPTIVLPAALPGMVDREKLRAILLHELVHLRRGDLLHCWGITVLQTVFWFHPAVWIAGELAAEERELCVDEALVTEARVPSFAYCRAILDVAELATGRFRGAVAFLGTGRRGGELERRIRNVLRVSTGPAPSPLYGWVFAIAFACTFVPMAPPTTVPPVSTTSIQLP